MKLCTILFVHLVIEVHSVENVKELIEKIIKEILELYYILYNSLERRDIIIEII